MSQKNQLFIGFTVITILLNACGSIGNTSKDQFSRSRFLKTSGTILQLGHRFKYKTNDASQSNNSFSTSSSQNNRSNGHNKFATNSRKQILSSEHNRNNLKNNKKLVSIAPDLPPIFLPEVDSPREYVLGSEDVLQVLVWKDANLSATVSIRPDGKISLPLIGDLQASGLTTTELKQTIKKRLSLYKTVPIVTVIVKEINSLSVFVLGEVTKPGKYKLKSEVTLLQAITLSGGFTQYASTNKIILLRRINGKEERLKIKYDRIISGKDPEGNLLLKRGDTIIVP